MTGGIEINGGIRTGICK